MNPTQTELLKRGMPELKVNRSERGEEILALAKDLRAFAQAQSARIVELEEALNNARVMVQGVTHHENCGCVAIESERDAWKRYVLAARSENIDSSENEIVQKAFQELEAAHADLKAKGMMP